MSEQGLVEMVTPLVDLGVTVHGRVNVRVMILDDLSDHRRLELETARFGPQHGTVVTHLLAE